MQKRPAQVSITTTVNGQTTRKNLCTHCVAAMNAMGQALPYTKAFSPLGGLFGNSLFGFNVGKSPHVPEGMFTQTVCPTCGKQYHDFKKTGLLGCSDCYTTFRPQLEQVIQRTQRGTVNVGRGPAGLERRSDDLRAATDHVMSSDQRVGSDAQPDGQSSEAGPTGSVDDRVSALRRQLRAAVEKEAYEDAAILRDQIRALEQERAET